MKKSFLLFVSPFLSLFCTLIIWLIGTGGILLPFCLLRDVCIPILHVAILGHFVKKYALRNRKIIVSALLFLMVTMMDTVLTGSIVKDAKQLLCYTVCNVLWVMICGLVIIGHTMALRVQKSKALISGVMVAEAMVVLLCHALVTWFVSPLLQSNYGIDDPEVLFLPLSAMILCLYSYLLGVTFTQPHIKWKLSAWLLGVATSVFVSLWLLGSPHTIPLADWTTAILWLVVSMLVFACSFVGAMQRKKRTDGPIYRDKEVRSKEEG